MINQEKEYTTMSENQKKLKLVSLALLALVVPWVISTISSMLGGIHLLNIMMLVATFFNILLGALGIGAANMPTRAHRLPGLMVIALLVNAAYLMEVFYYNYSFVLAIINALVVVFYVVFAKAVIKEDIH